MEHKDLMKNIENLIENELENARRRFNPINSSHEGYAIILEEFEELQEEILKFQQNLEFLWNSVKANNEISQKEYINQMGTLSKNIIKESAQLGAMCTRFDEDVLGKQ